MRLCPENNADRWVCPTEVPAHVCLLGMIQEGSTRIRGLAVDLEPMVSNVSLVDRCLLGEGGSVLANFGGNCRETGQRDCH